MTNERILELLKIERECITRNASNSCDRDCANCDIVQSDADLFDMYDQAIAAVQKQIPIEPICNGNPVTNNKCPQCGERLKSGRGSSSFYRNNWCNHCGQKIEWHEK